MLDLWGSQHDTDERAGEATDWVARARAALEEAAVEAARERYAARAAALRATAPAPGTAAVLRWTDPDAGGKTRVKRVTGTVEAVNHLGVRVRSQTGYRVTCGWPDFLARHANLRTPEGALLLGWPLRRDVALAGA
jgi:hypothetical protein